MHRSGTSVLTHVLHLLGAEVGEDLLEAEEEINAKGFWEHRQVVELNERLLQTLDRNWYDILPLPDNWQEISDVQMLQEEAVTFLEQAFGNADLAAIKDPRLCLLLPFWEAAARRASWTPRVILALRNPREVAASLCRRDPLDSTNAVLLWLRYIRDADHLSRTLPRTTVDYNQLLENGPATLSRIGERLGIEWPRPVTRAREAIKEAIDPSLRHQHDHGNDDGDELASLADSIYRQLTAATGSEHILHELWSKFDDLMKNCCTLANAVTRDTRLLFTLSERHHELGQAHARALAVIAERDQTLETRTREWESMGKDLQYCRSVVTERDRQLQSLNEEIQALNEEVRELGTRHEELTERHKRLEKSHRHLSEQYTTLVSHPLIRIVRKLFLRKER